MTAAADAPHIGLVVEGSGEFEALPLLLRRWLHEGSDFRDILGSPVLCHGRSKALKTGGIEEKVAVAAARPGCRAVLVVLDGEGDPVCQRGPELLMRSRESGRGKPIAVALADRQYEAWLMASAETLGLEGLAYSSTRDPVSALVDALRPRKYVKPVWQPRLTERIDFALAIPRSPSLRRLLDRFDELVRAL
jgi:Domain of unknown function (DUF4276)